MVAEICFTDRADGDFRIDGPPEQLIRIRRRVLPGEWTWLRQVHGCRVETAEGPGDRAGASADAVVTRCSGAALAVQTADCAPVCLVGDNEVAVAHAGWRGLLAGVLSATLDAMQTPPQRLVATIGPCIRPGSYEFSLCDLARVEEAAGPAARSFTAAGAPALDLAAAVASVLAKSGVERIDDLGLDTADERWYSHRVRGDSGRQATALRLVPA